MSLSRNKNTIQIQLQFDADGGTILLSGYDERKKIYPRTNVFVEWTGDILDDKHLQILENAIKDYKNSFE